MLKDKIFIPILVLTFLYCGSSFPATRAYFGGDIHSFHHDKTDTHSFHQDKEDIHSFYQDKTDIHSFHQDKRDIHSFFEYSMNSYPYSQDLMPLLNNSSEHNNRGVKFIRGIPPFYNYSIKAYLRGIYPFYEYPRSSYTYNEDLTPAMNNSSECNYGMVYIIVKDSTGNIKSIIATYN